MRKLIAVASAAVLVLVIAAPVGGSPASRIYFEGLLHSCSEGPPDSINVTPGGTVHIKGFTNTNQWATGNALIDGVENNVVFVSVNFKTTVVRLDITLAPDAYPGSTWEIMQAAQFRPDGSLVADGVGHGTGDLRGADRLAQRSGAKEAGYGNIHGLPLGAVETSGLRSRFRP